MRPTMARSRTSAPAFSARGIQTVNALCLALVEQPKRQKPRWAETVASGMGAHFTPMRSQPVAML